MISRSGARSNARRTRTGSIGVRRWSRPMRPELCRPKASSQGCGPNITRARSDFLGHVGPLNPVTIDARTLRTTYNVLDNHSGAKELWLRGGFDWNITNDVKLKSQVYRYNAQRHWFNSEVNAFNDSPTPSGGLQGQVYRERLSVDHSQKLTGNITDLIWNSRFAGMDNRAVATFAASRLQFDVVQDDAFTSDAVSLGQSGPRFLWLSANEKLLYARRQCLVVIRRPVEADAGIRLDRRRARRRDQTVAHRVRRRRHAS